MEKMVCSLSDLVKGPLPAGVDPNKIPEAKEVILGTLKGLQHLHSSGNTRESE
jgi:hypothetical protein